MKNYHVHPIIIATVITVLLIVLSYYFTKSNPYSLIQIPNRDNNYDNINSIVINSKYELEAVIKKISADGWNYKNKFEGIIHNANINYDKQALVLIRHTEGSGSVTVNFELPMLNSKTLKCMINRDVPQRGTLDMAYYCFALAVSRNAVDTIIYIANDHHKDVLLISDADH